MIWTYEMDLALCKLVYMNSPEILIEGIRDRSKNYHSVLNEFNKQFRLQVKQPRTVRARFERLLLDYKSRAKTKFASKGRESEIDMLMKTLVTMEAEYYENNKMPVSRPSSAESINVLTSGAMMEKAIDALKEVSQDELGAKSVSQISPKLRDITKNQNTVRGKRTAGNTTSTSTTSSNAAAAAAANTDWSNHDENNIFASYASSGRSFGTKKGLGDAKSKYQDSIIGAGVGASTTEGNMRDVLDEEDQDQDQDDDEDDEDADEDENEYPTIQPKLKRVRQNTVPDSQPFNITNYFSDNKTFIMNGDGGTQQWSGKSDLQEVTQRVQGDLENVKQDVQELSLLSKRIATILDRVTGMGMGMDSTGTSNINGAHTGSVNGTGNGNPSPNPSPE